MKIIKRFFSVVLAIAITLQCGNTAFAETASPRQEYSDDGVLYTYNADGTVTATIYTSPVVEERKTTSNEDDRLEDHGDSYVNTSEDVTVTLEKTYSDGDILVSLSDADTAIAFYPETAELTIRDGVLKINSDGHWTTYVMTNSGEIVLSGSSLLCYFSRVDQ